MTGTATFACGRGGAQCNSCNSQEACVGQQCVLNCTITNSQCSTGSQCCSGLCNQFGSFGSCSTCTRQCLIGPSACSSSVKARPVVGGTGRRALSVVASWTVGDPPATIEEVLDALERELSGTALSDRRQSFLDGLKKGSFVYLPRYRQRLVVHKVDHAKREVTVQLASQS